MPHLPVPGAHTHASGLVAPMMVVVLPSLQEVHGSVLPPVLKVPRPHGAHNPPPAPDSRDSKRQLLNMQQHGRIEIGLRPLALYSRHHATMEFNMEDCFTMFHLITTYGRHRNK